jgi:predicted Ser/Thr protein kinase
MADDESSSRSSAAPTIRKGFVSDTGLSGEDRLPPASLRLRYDELRCIGEGSMGTVFRGWDPRLGRAVALKLLKSDAPSDTKRFLAEARAQARVSHENVCRVYDVGEADGEPYIAMELIEGASLDRAHRGMTLEQKVKVIREVAAALHEAHRLGLIHRDVKPGNIMVVTTEDGSYKPFVVDFGLARDSSRGSASTLNSIVGTPAYMSPEQAAGDSSLLDRRTDVYSLGTTLFDIIAGRTPFVSSNALTLLTRVMNEDAPALGSVRKGVPKQLETIVMTCLQRDPERRYQSARALGEDLQRFLDGGPVQAKRPPLTYILSQKAKKHKALVVVGTIGLCFALILGGMWIHSARRATKQAELARELGEDVKYVELFLRSAYGFPTHDIAREERVVRARLVDIKKRMVEAGGAGEGPGHYAIGRAHVALHEFAAARAELERAITSGYAGPEVHYALGIALGGRYRESLDDARRIEDATARNAAVKKAESTYRDPALVHLRQISDKGMESKPYLEGLIALYENRHDDAVTKAITAASESPWLYEAHKLEGDARLEMGILAVDAGNQERGRELLQLATHAYQAAADMARSDAAIHEALAESWIQILALDKWQGRPYQTTLDAALAACNSAIVANPRSASGHNKKGRAYFHAADQLLRNGADPRPMLKLAISSASAALKLADDDVISLDGIGNAHTYIAKYERKLGLNPLPSLEQAMTHFDQANKIRPTFAWPWNDAGITFQAWAEYQNEKGVDPRPYLDRAVERFERAAKEEPSYLASLVNLIWVYSIRGSYELSIGQDPRPTVKQAVDSAERGSKVDPKFLPLLNNRGWAELVAAQYEVASNLDPSPTLDRVEASFQASLDINKDEADTQFGMGSAKHVRVLDVIRREVGPQKHFDEARAFLEKAALLDAQEPGIRYELGQLFMTMARHAIGNKDDPTVLLDNAERVFREGLRINARHAPLRAALAEVLGMRAEYVAINDFERETLIANGLAAAEEALAQNPKWALAMAAKGTLYAIRAGMKKDTDRAEDSRLAIEWLDKGLAINALLPARFKSRVQTLREGTARVVAQSAKPL